MSIDDNLKKLGKYMEAMGHDPDCMYYQSPSRGPCDCGFEAALGLMTDVGKVPEELREAKLQNSEMLELLRQADDLFTNYGLICAPIKDAGFPEYRGKVSQGEWIGKVRAILRQAGKQVEPWTDEQKKALGDVTDTMTRTIEKRKSVVACPSCGMAYEPTGPREVVCRECEKA